MELMIIGDDNLKLEGANVYDGDVLILYGANDDDDDIN